MYDQPDRQSSKRLQIWERQVCRHTHIRCLFCGLECGNELIIYCISPVYCKLFLPNAVRTEPCFICHEQEILTLPEMHKHRPIKPCDCRDSTLSLHRPPDTNSIKILAYLSVKPPQSLPPWVIAVLLVLQNTFSSVFHMEYEELAGSVDFPNRWGYHKNDCNVMQGKVHWMFNTS